MRELDLLGRVDARARDASSLQMRARAAVGAYNLLMASTKTRLGRIAAIIAVAIVAGACSSGGGYGAAGPTGPTKPPETTAGAEPSRGGGTETETDAPSVPAALRFTAPRLSGGTIRGETFAGSDVALWFWAPW
jgi:hypothetical protein